MLKQVDKLTFDAALLAMDPGTNYEQMESPYQTNHVWYDGDRVIAWKIESANSISYYLHCEA